MCEWGIVSCYSCIVKSQFSSSPTVTRDLKLMYNEVKQDSINVLDMLYPCSKIKACSKIKETGERSQMIFLLPGKMGLLRQKSIVL